MNKVKAIIIALIIMSTLTACVTGDQAGQTDMEANATALLQFVYEVGGTEYDGEDDTNHSNIISDEVEVSIDSNAETHKTIQFLGEEYNITYLETIFYPVGGEKVNRYTLPVNDSASILFLEDGSVFAILGNFTVIDISPDTSLDVVKAKVEVVISQWLDISQYKHFEVIPHGHITDSAFSFYEFQYYNIEQGYMTDWVKIIIMNTGEIGSIWIKNVSVNDEDLQTDKALEAELLELKLRDIFDTDTTSLLKYEQKKTPRIMKYNDELCVRYLVTITYSGYIDTEKTEMSTTCEILIPLHLLTTG